VTDAEAWRMGSACSGVAAQAAASSGLTTLICSAAAAATLADFLAIIFEFELFVNNC
jgi:hypothetical protein